MANFPVASRPSVRSEAVSLLTFQASSTSTSRASSPRRIIPPAPSPTALRSSTSSRASTQCSTSWTTLSWACECERRQSNSFALKSLLKTCVVFSSTQNGGEPRRQGQQWNLPQHAEHAPLWSEAVGKKKTSSEYSRILSLSLLQCFNVECFHFSCNRMSSTNRHWLCPQLDSTSRPRFMLLSKLQIWQRGTPIFYQQHCLCLSFSLL